MIIDLNKDWRLKSDDLQWHVQKRTLVKKGTKKYQWQSIAYCGQLDIALMLCWRRRIQIEEGVYKAEALRPLIDSFEKLEEEAKKIQELFDA